MDFLNFNFLKLAHNNINNNNILIYIPFDLVLEAFSKSLRLSRFYHENMVQTVWYDGHKIHWHLLMVRSISLRLCIKIVSVLQIASDLSEGWKRKPY